VFCILDTGAGEARGAGIPQLLLSIHSIFFIQMCPDNLNSPSSSEQLPSYTSDPVLYPIFLLVGNG